MGSWKHHGPKYCANWALTEESALGPGVRLRGAGAGGGEGCTEDSKRHILLHWVALSISNLFVVFVRRIQISGSQGMLSKPCSELCMTFSRPLMGRHARLLCEFLIGGWEWFTKGRATPRLLTRTPGSVVVPLFSVEVMKEEDFYLDMLNFRWLGTQERGAKCSRWDVLELRGERCARFMGLRHQGTGGGWWHEHGWVTGRAVRRVVT